MDPLLIFETGFLVNPKVTASYSHQGRLVLGDGSIYDGIWHNGKRSGLGTFYFKNGDVFQGTWREDLIHGKVK